MRDDNTDLTSLDVFLQQMLEDMSISDETEQLWAESHMATWHKRFDEADEALIPSSKRLIDIFEGADVASVMFWRSMEDTLGGTIIFKLAKKGTVDVSIYAYGNDPDLRIRALVAYTNWQINHNC